jgi:hypothetical protein
VRYKWIIPVVILVLLVAANAYRWDNNMASKTFDTGVVKWSQDRWTGHYWFSVYTIIHDKKKPEESNLAFKAPADRKNDDRVCRDTEVLTWCWRVATGAAALWLVFALIREWAAARKGGDK